jgi:threonine/homoserine/homoserine lactone efflux protein
VTLPAIFARALAVGSVVAAPVGAISLLCIQRTLARGRAAGYATGAGVATADAAYASIAAFGLAILTNALVSVQPWVRLLGGLALVWLGVRGMLARPKACAEERAGSALGAEYASAAGLTLANPQTILTFAAVFAGGGLAVSGGGWAAPAVTTLGVACGSFAWWVLLVSVVGALRARAGDRLLLWVNRVSGAAIAVLGAVSAWVGVAGLVR